MKNKKIVVIILTCFCYNLTLLGDAIITLCNLIQLCPKLTIAKKVFHALNNLPESLQNIV